MTTPDRQGALQAYLETIGTLYTTSTARLVERSGSADIAPTPDLEASAQTVIDRSLDVEQALAVRRSGQEPDQRELADLQLLAAAALDLQVASDLVRRAESGVPEEVRERSAELPSAYAELQAILAADPAQGMRALSGSTTERSSRPMELTAARAALRETVVAALADLRDDAADVGQKAVVGLTQLPLPAIQQASGMVFAEVMSRLGEGVAGLVKKAVTLIAQAIDKILAAMGKDAQDEVRTKLGEWIEDLRAGTLFATLLDRIAESERVKSEVLELIDAAPTTLDSSLINTASARIEELTQKFRKHKDVLTWVLKGLAWARSWIMPLVPWGPLGLSAAYATTIGYAVYAFADRADAYRLGGPERLDHLPGIRGIVRAELGSA